MPNAMRHCTIHGWHVLDVIRQCHLDGTGCLEEGIQFAAVIESDDAALPTVVASADELAVDEDGRHAGATTQDLGHLDAHARTVWHIVEFHGGVLGILCIQHPLGLDAEGACGEGEEEDGRVGDQGLHLGLGRGFIVVARDGLGDGELGIGGGLGQLGEEVLAGRAGDVVGAGVHASNWDEGGRLRDGKQRDRDTGLVHHGEDIAMDCDESCDESCDGW
mmetsp:Transcript_13334/g.36850  ORF Transcript_13334/g.36850 Transcript_13334/m.36850 type:complete len:219 (+) Transcript_13334:1510-2166(+)